MRLRKLTLVTLFIAIAFPVLSQLTIDGQFRPRFEYRDGYTKLTNDSSSASAHISQRTRLGLSYTKDRFSSRIAFQDVRIWGEEKGKTVTVIPSAYELWFGFKLNDAWKVKMGRQELAYDNHRMAGSSNYHNVGRSHDAFKIEFKKDNFTLHYATAFNQNTPKTDGTFYEMPGSYKTLNLIWLSYARKNFNISSLTIIDGTQDPNGANSTFQRYTPGLIAKIKYKMFNLDTRYFIQVGQNSMGKDVNANYFNADLSFKPIKNLKATLGTEIRSGNDVNTAEQNDFQFSISSNHKFNGLIDYFNFSKSTNGTGLSDQYIKVNYTVNKNFNILLDFHSFSSQQAYIVDGVEYDKLLATEFDLGVKYKFEKLSIFATYSIIMAEETLSAMKGGDFDVPGNFVSVMVTYKPVFLN